MSAQRPFFVLELANNHMGSVEHGLRVIRELAAVTARFPQFEFGLKFQYRDLDTFIHPAYRGRSDVKYVKRFSETRLSEEQFLQLLGEVRALGFRTVCTPFDEVSVGKVEQHGYEYLKIGSCSMTDWPLLERVAKTKLPLIVSTAGATLDEIDRVVSFFLHRDKDLTVMHCVGMYPTPDEALQLNQIELLRERYPTARIGYSTHERPDNTEAVQVALAKGATVFEKHVGVRSDEFSLNDYSATPKDVEAWLAAAARAVAMCGVPKQRPAPSGAERGTLRALQRGVFAARRIEAGERIEAANSLLAIPTVEGQLLANDLSKYAVWMAQKPLEPGEAVLHSAVSHTDVRARVEEIARRVKGILRESRVVVPGRLDLEISHHHGLEKFDEFGCSIVTLVNRDYCKKLIVVQPGQKHPEQWHEKKEETFHLLWGDLEVTLDGKTRTCGPGDIVLVDRGMRHAFTSRAGAVIEELSSTHYGNDSFYADEAINRNRDRKTWVTHWLD